MKNPKHKVQRLELTSAMLIIATLTSNGAVRADNVNVAKNNWYAHQSEVVSKKEDEMHHHQNLEIPPGQPIPTVKLIVHPDAMKGWNLEIQVTDFNFVPEKVNSTSSYTEGHAHLYINGKKITRLYGQWYYLSSLEPGDNELLVTLNTNKHETLVHNGKPIEAKVSIQVLPSP
jgi:hypothetical protein